MEDAAALDRTYPLRSFRDRFLLPEGVIYLDGNSLGPLPRATPERIAEVVQREWGVSLIRAWNEHGWIDMARRVGDKIGRLIGAEPGSTIVADSTSINIFKCLSAALALRPGRTVILSEAGNFPTDIYIAEGMARSGCSLRVVDDPVAALNRDIAVLMLTHVNYRTGAMQDMAAVTQAAHRAGALVLWDLSHSAGAVELNLADDAVDFAVGCGYRTSTAAQARQRFCRRPRGIGRTSASLSPLVGPRRSFRVRSVISASRGCGWSGRGNAANFKSRRVGGRGRSDARGADHQLRAKSVALTERNLSAMRARGFHSITPSDPRGAAVRCRSFIPTVTRSCRH